MPLEVISPMSTVGQESRCYRFGECRLHMPDGTLRRENRTAQLPPTAALLLQYLASRPGKLCTKRRLLDEVWGDATVSEGVLKTQIAFLRKILGESAERPKYIQTVHRRGYRFTSPEELVGGREATFTTMQLPELAEPIARLHRAQDMAWQGVSQVSIVTGRSGSGKATLIDTLSCLAPRFDDWFCVRARCMERSAGFATAPPCDAGSRVVLSLEAGSANHIPASGAAWSKRFARVLQSGGSVSFRAEQFQDVLESLLEVAAATPTRLVIEDVQWAEPAVHDLLVELVRRRGLGRAWVVGTLQSSGRDPILARFADIQLRQTRLSLIRLPHWSENSIRAYLEQRFDSPSVPNQLVQVIKRETSGIAGWVTHLVDCLLERDVIRASGGNLEVNSPAGCVETHSRRVLSVAIEHCLLQLQASQIALLEAASTLGTRFDVAALARLVGRPPGAIDRELQHVGSRRGLVEPCESEICLWFRFCLPMCRRICFERASQWRACFSGQRPRRPISRRRANRSRVRHRHPAHS